MLVVGLYATEFLRESGSLDDIPASWDGINLMNCDETPSRFRSGVKQFIPMRVNEGLHSTELVSGRLGQLIFVKKSSFRAIHHDLREVQHSFATHLYGRKLWIFCQLSYLANELNVAARRTAFSDTVISVQRLSKTQAKQIFRVLVEPGYTVYFPYGFFHSVGTEVYVGRISCIATVGKKISGEWEKQQTQLSRKYTATSEAHRRFVFLLS